MCNKKTRNLFEDFIRQLKASADGRKRRGESSSFWVNFNFGDDRHVRFMVDKFEMKVMKEDLIVTPSQMRNVLNSG